ncbi:MAG: hypothetical protein KA783_09045 [Chitinophagales bacterium]|nr:hypothetical protein [Chitinophagales bacterium]MBP7534584.1 hypothetical protein [Chitinophagales bacterium]
MGRLHTILFVWAFCYHYVFKDHLGSILRVTNASGTTEADQSFDAWGRRRNPTTWAYTGATPPTQTWLYRGYTAHEHLDQFALINMNGRLYDPTVGRMLSPDNYVQDALYAQTFNRYSYAHNNPLKFVDPDGETPLLVGILISSLISGTVYTVDALIHHNFSWYGLGQSLAIGAVNGFVAGSIGGSIPTSLGNSITTNVFSNILIRSTRAIANGQDYSMGNLTADVIGGVLGGFIGGYNPTSGGAVENIFGEIAFSASKGAVIGGVSGGISAAFNGTYIGAGILQGMKSGAVSGAIFSGLTIAALGYGYQPHISTANFGNYKPIFRHPLWGSHDAGNGITIGRNCMINYTDKDDYLAYIEAHEMGHFAEQRDMGFVQFYGKTMTEYSEVWFHIAGLYETPGTLEFSAELYALGVVGHFWSSHYNAYISYDTVFRLYNIK